MWGMLISLATFIGCCIYLVVTRFKQSSLS
jgi:hypothetical protein